MNISQELYYDVSKNVYIIYPLLSYIKYISNLEPNTFYNLNFNDYSLSIMSDKNGDYYFNKEEGLKISNLPYTVVSISKGNYLPREDFLKPPKGNFYGLKTPQPSKIDLNKPINVNIDLTYREIKNKTESFVIKNGGLDKKMIETYISDDSKDHSFIGVL